MTNNRNRIAARAALPVSLLFGGLLHADILLPFGVFGFPLDMSVSTKDILRPSNTVVSQDSIPLFDTVQGDSVKLLSPSSTGVNGSGRSTNIHSAFASSLAEAVGNGGDGVSQLIFGSPDPSGLDSVRELMAETLWTQTFRYDGTFPVDINLHLHIPEIQVGLLGVPPRRTGISDTETAVAGAILTSQITHPDLTISRGGGLEVGLNLGEVQFPSGSDILNVAQLETLGQTGMFGKAPVFSGDDFDPVYTLDSISTTVHLGTMHTGDILSFVYTLDAFGTTHGFERGYFAFIGDPFGVDVIGDNLQIEVTPAATDTPEASTSWLMALGLTFVFLGRRRSLTEPRA